MPTITATTRPNANSPRDTQAVSWSNERQNTKPSTQNVVAHSAGAEHVVGQELAQRHARRAGDERRDRAHEADEAADQDRHPAAPLEERLDLLQALLGDLHPRAVADHEVAPEPAAERVGGEVARDRAGPDDRDQHEQRDLALPGDEAADDHGRLPGAIRPMNAPVSRKASTPTARYVHLPSAWPASSISFSTFGSSITPNPISAAPTAASAAERERRAAVRAAADDEVEGERDGAREPDGMHGQAARGAANARPTGVAATACGWRERSASAAARAWPTPSLAREEPEHRRARSPTPSRARRRTARTSASASPIGGQSERAGASRSLCSSRSASSESVARGAGDLAAQPVELVGVAAEAEPVELGVDGGRGERVRRGHDEQRRTGRSRRAGGRPRRCRSSGSAPARAGSARRRRARRRAACSWAASPSPEAAAASRSAAAASAEPPPIPAATGTRLAIVIRTGGPSQPVAARKRASAAAARFSPSTPGQTTSSRVAGGRARAPARRPARPAARARRAGGSRRRGRGRRTGTG